MLDRDKGKERVREDTSGYLKPDANSNYDDFNSTQKEQKALLSEINNFDRTQLRNVYFRIKKLILPEIKYFDRSKLRNPNIVYYVNRSLQPYKPFYNIVKTHGYIAIGKPGISQFAPGHAIIYFYYGDWTHSPYIVSSEVVKYVKKHPDIFNPVTKKIIMKLEGSIFASTEHFIRTLLREEAKLLEKNINENEIYDQALCLKRKLPSHLPIDLETDEFSTIEPDDDLVRLVHFINGLGKAQLYNCFTKPSLGEQDRYMFCCDSNKVSYKAYPKINAEYVREVYNQQQLFTRYLDEKGGIGKVATPAMKKRADKHPKETRIAMSFFPTFKEFPNKENNLSANCNKGIATLLQDAENLSAAKQGRCPERICAPSIWGVGSTQRMTLWKPLEGWEIISQFEDEEVDESLIAGPSNPSNN